jgi:hypothetical protein
MLKRAILGTTLAVSAMLCAMASQSQPSSPQPGQTESAPQKTEGGDTKQQAQPDQHETKPPVATEKIATPDANAKPKSPENRGENKTDNPGRFDELSTGDKIAVIATLVGFLQFVALVATVAVMRRSAQRQLRAYVSASPDFVTSFDETHWPTAKMTIRNLGQTPAYDLTHRSEIAAWPYPLPSGFKLPPVDERKASAPTVLFPNVPLRGGVPKGSPFSGEELAAIREGRSRVYIFGEAHYRDIFRKKCWITYCVSMTADKEVIAKLAANSGEIFPDGTVSYEASPIGNDASRN